MPALNRVVEMETGTLISRPIMLCGRTVATDEPTERVVRYEGWAEPNSKTGLDLSKNTSKG